MRKGILSLLGLLLCTLIVPAQQLKVDIVQREKPVVGQGNIFQLDNAPFSFQIKSDGVEGFLVGITTEEDIYRSAIGEADLEVMWYENTGMAEPLFNTAQELWINNEAPSYWYFSDEEDHRFDRDPKGNAKQWTGRRSVERLYHMDSDAYQVLSAVVAPMYVVFYAPVYDDEYNLIDKVILFHATLRWKDKQ